MGSQLMQPDLSTSQTLHIQYRNTKMNKHILMLGLAVTLLCLASLPSVEADGLLNRICEKCNYCKTDPNCDGCQRCGECSSRSQRGCRFCKKGEDENGCRDRCTKGCRICGGKDGEGLESCKNN